ncbi:MAG TPA: type VI secretion system contractile sheath small subunit [Pyrinomonadaceae bacterium]|nr:type VI secretion system contractile sheath small subunit [Pyrinomonadaceae bacterium]
MAESTQHKLDRIRPPRVQITYDVETRGSFVKRELPFVVGIMADLSGDFDASTRVPIRDRKYMDLDRDNFNDIMKFVEPSISLNGGSKTLEFKNLDDFSPINVLKQIEVSAQFEKRTRLSDMVAKLDGNVKLQNAMLQALSDDTQRAAMKTKVDEIKGMLEEKTEDPVTPPPATREIPATKPTEGGKKK